MRVVEKPSSPPTSDDEGDSIWSTSYSDTGTEEIEGLSGSILSAILPDFEIGSWYSLESFKEKLNAAVTGEATSWTTMDVMSKAITGPGYIEMQVQQDLAALMICRAVVDHLNQIDRDSAIWIRIE